MYFSGLDFSEVEKFNLLTSSGCKSVTIAKDMRNHGRKEVHFHSDVAQGIYRTSPLR